jgi:hypothetical protein
MISNLSEFNATVTRFAENIPAEKVVLMHKKMGLEALRRVVMKTPVDTGRARGNWQVQIGEPALVMQDSFDKTGSDTIQIGAAQLANLKAYEVIYLTNNVPYIIFLEEGSSKQAPYGMVKMTIDELAGMFK